MDGNYVTERTHPKLYWRVAVPSDVLNARPESIRVAHTDYSAVIPNA